MLDKKQIWVIFLFRFKMGCKAEETTHNIKNAFVPGTANECTVPWWFKKFCKGDESLKVRSEVAGCWMLTMTNWEPSLKLILFQLHEKLQKNSMSTILWSFGTWSKLERWKSLVNECLMSWPKKKKNHCFEMSSSLILCNNNEPFLHQIVMCDEKWILYDNWPAQWLDWEEIPEHFPKPNLHQKRVMITIWWSVAGLIHYSFLNPGKTVTSEKYAQQINEMYWKLQCLQPAVVNRKGSILLKTTPNYTSHNQRFKSWTNWALKFCLICHIHLTFHRSTTTSSSILIIFCGEMPPQPAGCRKCFPKVHWILKPEFLCYREKKLILLVKMC